MTIIGEKGGGFFFVLWSATFYVPIPFISAFEADENVTCARTRIRACQIIIELPVSERPYLTRFHCHFPKLLLHMLIMYHAGGQYIKCCVKYTYEELISMRTMRFQHSKCSLRQYKQAHG